ncbi:MAG TPA: redox-sensing transcriptional repressor Rex, partial [Thermoanaerobaculia bacterium]|nr:redox-sensing transcriptional repressor Rex [Thermoanaerobaculia bacterium]
STGSSAPSAAEAAAAVADVSPLTLNRLSLYLRCLQDLHGQGVERVSSKELAERYQLSASQIRKDLAQFGEFGIRGVGYEIEHLRERLRALLGLDRQHGLVILGVGSLGTALARFAGFNQDGYRVVGLVDADAAKVGRRLGELRVDPPERLAALVRETGATIGVLAVPAAAAQAAYNALAAGGVRAVLNFAPTQIRARRGVRLKTVDLRVDLEELGFFLARER